MSTNPCACESQCVVFRKGLTRFAYAGKFEIHVKEYKFRQEGNQVKECHSPNFLLEKLHRVALRYIHQNPVRNLIVEEAKHYLFSSARNYAGMQRLIDVIILLWESRWAGLCVDRTVGRCRFKREVSQHRLQIGVSGVTHTTD